MPKRSENTEAHNYADSPQGVVSSIAPEGGSTPLKRSGKKVAVAAAAAAVVLGTVAGAAIYNNTQDGGSNPPTPEPFTETIPPEFSNEAFDGMRLTTIDRISSQDLFLGPLEYDALDVLSNNGVRVAVSETGAPEAVVLRPDSYLVVTPINVMTGEPYDDKLHIEVGDRSNGDAVQIALSPSRSTSHYLRFPGSTVLADNRNLPFEGKFNPNNLALTRDGEAIFKDPRTDEISTFFFDPSDITVNVVDEYDQIDLAPFDTSVAENTLSVTSYEIYNELHSRGLGTETPLVAFIDHARASSTYVEGTLPEASIFSATLESDELELIDRLGVHVGVSEVGAQPEALLVYRNGWQLEPYAGGYTVAVGSAGDKLRINLAHASGITRGSLGVNYSLLQDFSTNPYSLSLYDNGDGFLIGPDEAVIPFTFDPEEVSVRREFDEVAPDLDGYAKLLPGTTIDRLEDFEGDQTSFLLRGLAPEAMQVLSDNGVAVSSDANGRVKALIFAPHTAEAVVAVNVPQLSIQVGTDKVVRYELELTGGGEPDFDWDDTIVLKSDGTGLFVDPEGGPRTSFRYNPASVEVRYIEMYNNLAPLEPYDRDIPRDVNGIPLPTVAPGTFDTYEQ